MSGRGGGRGQGICYKYQNTGRCDRGSDCHYSHGSNGRDDNAQPARRAAAPTKAKDTEEQRTARKSYTSWKRLLGEESNDAHTMRRVWEGAFNILEAGDRDWRQQLPQDLDDDDEMHQGRAHILALLSTKVVGGDYGAFVANARNFLLTLTHHSLLRCLAVDTHVGSIYNLFGGAGGNRAVIFLRRLCEALLAARAAGHSLSSSDEAEGTLQAMSVALFELLKRERRARFNEEILKLVESIQAATNTFEDTMPSTITRITNRLNDVRAMIARAQDLLADDTLTEDDHDDANTSFYPREMVVPSDRHDNDKKDIAEITIFPTRDEIVSDAKDFLPYTDPNQPHFLEDPVQRHIDTYFRLLRHDIFGDLKGALAGVMHAVGQNQTQTVLSDLSLGDMRAYQYANARVSYIRFEARRGIQAQIEFLQPGPIRKKTAAEKERWWEESRRFEEGSLLSLIWVQDGAVQHVFLSVSEKITDPAKEYGLTNHNTIAFITTSLVTQDRSTIRTLMQAKSRMARGVLLEFPKVMPATFVPIMECLKAMQRLNRLPFRQWIIPAKNEGPSRRVQKVHDVPPPLYARNPGFRFPLRTLVKVEDDSFSIEPTSSSDDEAILDKLEAKTQLDRGQCRALVAALTREFAFIQGPPGTGKSYIGLQIMRVLLDIKEKADLGPILIVCFTNHALDQFLEHLLEIGVKKLIRVGGMSKSKKLENHNLRTIGELETKTKAEKYMAAMNYKELEKKEKEATSILAGLHGLQKRAEWQNLKAHIHEEYPKIYNQFRRVDDHGFKAAGRHPFDIWKPTVTSNTAQTPAALLRHILQKATIDVYSLSIHERSALVVYWIEKAQGNKVGELFEIANDAAKTQHALSNIHEELNRRILEEADVIGVTTSGLAKRISVLQQVKCKVIICEEAGEVMEPHMLAALLPDAEHVIQIGDHEQLRPSVQNFRDLSLESEQGKLHQLDKSQFERLSTGEPGRPLMPVAQLNVQRRMRPQISNLIRETIYDKLKDHSSTHDLPDVVGMRRNVFWLDHVNLENEMDTKSHDTKSKSNIWEVKMVHALVRHVVRQGVYKSDDIAVLTPYTGQLQKLRVAMSSDFEICLSDRDQEALEKDVFAVDDDRPDDKAASDHQDHTRKPLEKKKLSELLRVATVDNFQGEEAKIIIVSLVRSNERRNVGFLKTTNRINVLLSRAQHGMYLIGNADTYSSVNTWQKVISMLRATDSVGKSLDLCCPRHPETAIEVKQPDDFHKSNARWKLSEKASSALHRVRLRWLAVTHVLGTAIAALPRPCSASPSREPAITTVLAYATMALTAASARSLARYAVNIHNASSSAMSPARPVSKSVCGNVSIKAHVRCPVLPHAIGFPATSAAPNCFPAATNALAFEFKSYSEIDLDESPIIVLGCGHPFTTEFIDGLVRLQDVYEREEKTGRYIGLVEDNKLAALVPKCPDCRMPIKQYVTQRYNRLINRAVIDEMSKRFIVNGQQELQQLEDMLKDLMDSLEESRKSVVPAFNISLCGDVSDNITMRFINDGVKNRSEDAISLTNAIKSFRHRMDIQHKPTYKLHQATVHAVARSTSLDSALAIMTIELSAQSVKRDRDLRVMMGGCLLELKMRCLVLEDNFHIARAVKLKNLKSTLPLNFGGDPPDRKTEQFLQDCKKLADDCIAESLPRLAVEATLYYARIAQVFASSGLAKDADRARATGYCNTAKELLRKADQLCEHSFRDQDILRQATVNALAMLDKEFYESVSEEEMHAIKLAMVSGRGGIATHSGHWYNCANGHPFAVGECGMPMEEARCPECGAPVGGQNHVAVAGVSRATQMEN
ncbi:NFX1-type zinc finger-containing protein 1 [Clathrospora elynae]|uniref:NFX1-type zinc finger-containing protein 1 n=1 Tax=Clathrospora elynae TaxID=706981 RepID=A0A6A5T2E7_9PLEO|nr:NFX1-type zinc finger-containing protein 1 [Clathrospora elynae]